MPQLSVANGGVVRLADIPVLPGEAFRQQLLGLDSADSRVAALFLHPSADGNYLTALVAHGPTGLFEIMATEVGQSFPSLTAALPSVHWFERDIYEQSGVLPAGHPWLKPNRFPGGDAGSADTFVVRGSEIHEVAVGPIHAGVIEPGHFRFQCRGEEVMHLEVSLGFQHRGVEEALCGGPDKRTIHYLETLAGDTSIGHATAYAQIVEALSETAIPASAEIGRAVALELERMANHAGDLGALSGDAGYLPTASYCGRIRGDLLNLTAEVCGNRFGRGWVVPGGLGFDITAAMAVELENRLGTIMRDLTEAVDLLWDTPSVIARLEGVGTVSRETAQEIGLVGVAARASGLVRDARYEFPHGAYRLTHVPVATWESGDVFARATVRWQELQRSAEFVATHLTTITGGDLQTTVGSCCPDSLAISMVEGWRGEICHVAITDRAGRFAQYKVYDPSIHNWLAVALALRGEQISDFPLCNKSFNLSYCGHDL